MNSIIQLFQALKTFELDVIISGQSFSQFKELLSAKHKKYALSYHPDRHTDLTPEARTDLENRMKEINSAYDILKSMTNFDFISLKGLSPSTTSPKTTFAYSSSTTGSRSNKTNTEFASQASLNQKALAIIQTYDQQSKHHPKLANLPYIQKMFARSAMYPKQTSYFMSVQELAAHTIIELHQAHPCLVSEKICQVISKIPEPGDRSLPKSVLFSRAIIYALGLLAQANDTATIDIIVSRIDVYISGRSIFSHEGLNLVTFIEQLYDKQRHFMDAPILKMIMECGYSLNETYEYYIKLRPCVTTNKNIFRKFIYIESLHTHDPITLHYNGLKRDLNEAFRSLLDARENGSISDELLTIAMEDNNLIVLSYYLDQYKTYIFFSKPFVMKFNDSILEVLMKNPNNKVLKTSFFELQDKPKLLIANILQILSHQNDNNINNFISNLIKLDTEHPTLDFEKLTEIQLKAYIANNKLRSIGAKILRYTFWTGIGLIIGLVILAIAYFKNKYLISSLAVEPSVSGVKQPFARQPAPYSTSNVPRDTPREEQSNDQQPEPTSPKQSSSRASCTP